MSTVNATTVKCTTIQHTNGTNALTIDSSGRVLKPAQPAFFANSSSSSVSNSSIVPYNNVLYNIGSHYNGSSTYRFTAPVTGIYHIGFMLRINANFTVNTYGQLMLHVNGASNVNGNYLGQSIYGTGVLNNQYASMCCNTQLSLSANDYVDVRNVSANAVTLNYSSIESYFYAYLLG